MKAIQPAVCVANRISRRRFLPMESRLMWDPSFFEIAIVLKFVPAFFESHLISLKPLPPVSLPSPL